MILGTNSNIIGDRLQSLRGKDNGVESIIGARCIEVIT